MRRLCIVAAVLLACIASGAQITPARASFSEQIAKLSAEKRWEELVSLLAPLSPRSADENFYYATALSRLERWAEAETAFEAGARLAPKDPRFPLESAGVAFRQKRYSDAVHRLRRALALDPQDAYANDFLATIYFLRGNLEAALKYWNRAGKPVVTQVQSDPVPNVDPALLDRAFAFAPAETLLLPDFLETQARIRQLNIFPRYQFDLRAREDEKFDVWFRGQERNGFGRTKWEALLSTFRGLPFLTLTPEYYNLGHGAVNFLSLVRWDPEKRRVWAQLSSPFEHSAKYRYDVTADVRNENWDIRTLSEPVLDSLNLRREALAFSIGSSGGRWSWSAGAELSHRDFRNVSAGTALTPDLLAAGFQLKQTARLGLVIWRVPEKRFSLQGGISSEAARLWSRAGQSFEKLQSSLEWHWYPQAEGSDYEVRQQFRVGKSFGRLPFDELAMLGIERDNDLPLRAHVGTSHGRKGSAPLGRDYFLSNWEMDKRIYDNGLVRLTLGPFLDTGKITDSSPQLGSNQWLWDVGGQVKLRVLGAGVAFSFGRDLRTGNNAFYIVMLK